MRAATSGWEDHPYVSSVNNHSGSHFNCTGDDNQWATVVKLLLILTVLGFFLFPQVRDLLSGINLGQVGFVIMLLVIVGGWLKGRN